METLEKNTIGISNLKNEIKTLSQEQRDVLDKYFQ